MQNKGRSRRAWHAFVSALEDGQIEDYHKKVELAHLAIRTMGLRRFRRQLRTLSGTELDGISISDWELIAKQHDSAARLFNYASAEWDIAGHQGLSIRVFRECLSMGFLEAKVPLGELLIWIGQIDEGMTLLREAVKDEAPNWRHAASVLAVELYRSEPTPLVEIEGLLKAAGAEADFEARVVLSHTLIRLGEFHQARRILEDEVKRGSDVAPIVLGNLLDDCFDDQEAAERAYRIGIDRGDYFSAYNLSLLLENLGRLEESRAMCVLAAEHGDVSALQRLRQEN